ncbi:hypothetical protein ScPMuIL_006233 [Solemya velum]
MSRLNDFPFFDVQHPEDCRISAVHSVWWGGTFVNTTNIFMEYIWKHLEHLDIDYLTWVLWVVYPIVISFLLPLFILIFLYASAIFLHVYHYRHRLRDAYAKDFWDGARKTLSAVWVGQARIWHGYEIHGFEKLPSTGPALMIYYHGTLPIDFYYIMAKCILEKNRQIRAVGDNFLFNMPGWRLLMEVFCVAPGTVQSCIGVLNAGHILAIAPGGVREALFGDEYYPVMWGKRTGFAKVALQTHVPVIPVFTQNVREAFRTPSFGKGWMRKLYEMTRLPLMPIYGFFPVKLRTFIGDPIQPDKDTTPEQLATTVQEALKDMIKEHQRIPGNILRALFERVYSSDKQKSS